MIADIDFRWVKRIENVPIKGCEMTLATEVKALQYRKNVEIEPKWVDTDNGLMLCSHQWTDWQDVPVVEE